MLTSVRLTSVPKKGPCWLAVLSISCCLALLAATARAQPRPPDLARGMSAELEAQGRLMWIDGTANLVHTVTVQGVKTVVDYTTTREGVAEIVRHCKAAHINTLVVDVKPLSGYVLYNSKIAPHLRTWKGRPVPDFDLLAAFVAEGHKAGLQVDAGINILSEGHKLAQIGPAYEHPDWQSVVYAVDRGLFAPDGTRLALRIPGEPDDPTKPALLSDDRAILSDEPSSGLIGLEPAEHVNGAPGFSWPGGSPSGSAATGSSAPGSSSASGGSGPGGSSSEGAENASFGKQINLALNSDNRITGMVDSALLGDDPLVAPEGGHLLTATRPADVAWIAQHLQTGQWARFDFRTTRLPIVQAPSERVACFINMLHPEARRHELDIVREIVANYAIDGLVLDRCRYSNLYNDFSDRAHDAFLQWLRTEAKIRNPHLTLAWPADVFAFSPTPGGELIYGPLYKLWLEFRAQNIRDFVGEVARTARSLKPDIMLGTYVGAWYPRYYEVGVNWGSEKTALRYAWFTPDYPRTGYAEFFNWISTGCYYPVATREEARRSGLSEKATVEYAAELSNSAIASGAFVYPGINVTDYAGRPEEMLRALEAAGRQGQGWMIFDLTYIEEYGWWPLLERAFPHDSPSPDSLRDLLPALRTIRSAAQ